jgi:hypothetical protein
VLYRRLPSTNFRGLRKRKSAPQKVKPKPISAKIWDPEYMEKRSEKMPEMRNRRIILPETEPSTSRFDFESKDFCKFPDFPTAT